MKKVLSTAAIALTMILSYVAGRHHTARNGTADTSARHVLYWVDPMHPDYKSDHAGIAPDCGMQLEPVYEQPASAAVVPAAPAQPGTIGIDPDKQQLFGIRVAAAERTSASTKLRVLGRVSPEDTRVYRITSGSEGFIRSTFNDSVGELVKKDQKLATSYVGETLSIASGFLAATAGLPGVPPGRDGSRTMPFPGAVSKQGFSSVQGYTDRLRNLGVSEAQIQQMAESHQLPETIDIVAPADGFILARNVSPGQHFDRSMEFYRIADLTKVWIVADVFDSEVQNFHPGTVARVTLTDSQRTFTARVSNVLPQVDPATRTLKLRLEADNPGFALRPDMFVDVELPVSEPAGLTVPLDALIDSGREQRVFVERSSGVFEPRQVHVGWRSGDRVEIVDGLKEGERVVTAGTFLVDSESRLRSVQPATKQQAPQEKVAPKSNPQPKLAASFVKVKDAACGMMIDKAKSIAEGNTLTRDGVTYYFCSQSCKRKFAAQPEHYLAANPSGQGS
ncbi:MAG TPA: efflux RND transporter periplasmic adaptor subunit [Candidatus Sulfotelmatobacter sp.]|jgi:membrane fusion protein, copper/silver efflux system|nr:efflux RND transporter periplasmic adaptor subunit [Candidatus Sulfotelmatobacter sp.]